MMKRILSFFVLISLVLACSSGGNEPSGPTDNFDRSLVLKQAAEKIIIPAFQNFNTKLSTLKTKTTAFTTTANATTLNEVRIAWLAAYKAWQHVEMFNIGKAEELAFVNHMNIYPVTTGDIDTNIANGGYDLNHPNNHDAQGFPALDYLFYGVGANDTAILEKYTTNANAAKYKKYVTDVVAKMSDITTQIITDWNGGYKTTFINSSGNTATSSLNKLVNDFIFYYEKGLRANKFGIPAGNFSATPLPNKVEAFYRKDVSKELALEALSAVKAFFNGYEFNTTTPGSSFKAYLDALNKSDLVTKINNQFDAAKNQINTLNANFYQQINSDNAQMTKAYDELQKAVVFLKVDMLQAFNVSVDYVDADGD